MREKTEQIIEAALRVFLKKGYKESTTQEIAKEADVAEVTLFRKFQNKQNLFFSVFKPIIVHQFSSRLLELAKLKDTEEFFKEVINDRLVKISKNKEIFRILMAESIMGNLESEIDLPQILFAELKKALKVHFELKKIDISLDEVVRALGGIFLSHLMWPQKKPYHQLNEAEQRELVNNYLLMIKPILKEK